MAKPKDFAMLVLGLGPGLGISWVMDEACAARRVWCSKVEPILASLC